jgi:hypothetical protein
MAVKIIVNQPVKRPDETISIYNGDLIIVELSNKQQQVYIVSSYIAPEQCDIRESQSCCLIDLSTGGKAFREPCTRRNTTYKRLASHLAGQGPFIDPMKMKIIRKDNYSLSINVISGEDK